MSSPLEIKALNNFVNDANFVEFEKQAKTFQSATFRAGKKPIRIILAGELGTDGINTASFDNGDNHSFGLILEEEESEVIESFTELVEKQLADAKMEGWEVSPLINDNRLFIKVKYDIKKKKFIPKCNVKLDIKKLGELDLYRGQNVTVTADLHSWYNYTDKKAGVYFKVNKIDFDLGTNPPVLKKSKKE